MEARNLSHPPEDELGMRLRRLDSLYLNGTISALEKHLGCNLHGVYKGSVRLEVHSVPQEALSGPSSMNTWRSDPDWYKAFLLGVLTVPCMILCCYSFHSRWTRSNSV